MLDLAILGLLEQGELHGYEIRRRLREHLGLLANVSFGSLYPALNRLEAAGALSSQAGLPAAPAPHAPPTGSLSGERAVLRARRHSAIRGGRRLRKVYRITDSGRSLFSELLASDGADDARGFGLRVAFARHLAPSARLDLLDRRRSILEQRLAEARSSGADPSLDLYARSVVEHTADTIVHEIAWLDRLATAERSEPTKASVSQRAGTEGIRP